MANTQRKYLIAGNWKMNKTAGEAVDFAERLKEQVGQQSDVTVLVCAPYTALAALAPIFGDSMLCLGAQNMNPEISGAYTGEISAAMLRDHYVSYVIVGHSERRQLFNEDDAFINKKVVAALEANLKPILCVGETLEQRKAGQTIEVIKTQVENGLKGVAKKDAQRVVIAYEPIWAIGTGETASPEMAQEVHASIRAMLGKVFGKDGNKLLILYGGSMKPENAEALLSQHDIDGGLIGGASLSPKSFFDIVKKAQLVTASIPSGS